MAENAALMEMYHKCADLKCTAVQEYVELLLQAGQKFLIFGHHKVLLDAIEHTLNRSKAGNSTGAGGNKSGCKFIRIDGSTPPSTRTALVNEFQQNDSVRVALLGIKAAGVGLTLTAASLVVFAELTWTPGEIIQVGRRFFCFYFFVCVFCGAGCSGKKPKQLFWKHISSFFLCSTQSTLYFHTSQYQIYNKNQTTTQ